MKMVIALPHPELMNVRNLILAAFLAAEFLEKKEVHEL
ncbi:hypothetical protein Arcve_0662 [Archaeoglobus veneficus SNP6]|uniref:Uncharacterized protein n=1 Tax=Archaeoglobus veneficus (strain DSM 11195 / SNP6) TaxID=693661 RepID=F2KR45_ARCVS|nr:hypothetical protein Arcve_0662 [Archaeoglobus veneficus SNP6]